MQRWVSLSLCYVSPPSLFSNVAIVAVVKRMKRRKKKRTQHEIVIKCSEIWVDFLTETCSFCSLRSLLFVAISWWSDWTDLSHRIESIDLNRWLILENIEHKMNRCEWNWKVENYRIFPSLSRKKNTKKYFSHIFLAIYKIHTNESIWDRSTICGF